MVRSVNEFTISQFQEWNKAISDPDPADRILKQVACVIGKTLEEVEDIPKGELYDLCDQVRNIDMAVTEKVKPIIWLNKKPYWAITNAKHLNELMSTNQFTAAQTYSRTVEDSTANLHRILPLFYTPLKFFRKPKLADNQQELAELFKSAKVGDVAGAVFFYSRLYEKLWEVFEPYSREAVQTITNTLNEIAQENDFQSPTDGITQ